MDFSLNDHQRLIRDTVRQFMETEVRPFVKEWEKQEKFPAEAVRKLGEMGCCGVTTPEEWGGPGLDTISYALIMEEVARVFTALSTAIGVTCSAVQAPLLLFGNEAQKKKYIRRMATGETLGAFCLTEPAAGSDAAGIQARAVREGNSYRLNGTKTWVSNGSVAGVLRKPILRRAARASARFSLSRAFRASRWAATRTRWASGRRRQSKFC